MRVIIDANVLISAITLQPSRVTPIIEYLFRNEGFFITPQIAQEFARNSLRLRPHMAPQVQEFLNRIELTWINDSDEDMGIIHRHANDQPILNAAIQNDLDIIISDDKGFHALEIGHPRIMRPADFIAEFIEEPS